MNQNEILKQIDDLIDKTEFSLPFYHFTRKHECYLNCFKELKEIMQNYEKVLEIEHFKQTEL
jgi:hypothetical protein